MTTCDCIINVSPKNATQIAIGIAEILQAWVKLALLPSVVFDFSIESGEPIHGGIIGSINISNNFDDIVRIQTGNPSSWLMSIQGSEFLFQGSGF